MTDFEIEAIFVQGDTGPTVQASIHAYLDAADEEDLTGAEVAFQMRKLDDRHYMVNAVATIVDAADGTIQYDWATNDLSVPGVYLVQWQVTYDSGRIQTTRPRYIEVRRQ